MTNATTKPTATLTPEEANRVCYANRALLFVLRALNQLEALDAEIQATPKRSIDKTAIRQTLGTVFDTLTEAKANIVDTLPLAKGSLPEAKRIGPEEFTPEEIVKSFDEIFNRCLDRMTES